MHFMSYHCRYPIKTIYILSLKETLIMEVLVKCRCLEENLYLYTYILYLDWLFFLQRPSTKFSFKFIRNYNLNWCNKKKNKHRINGSKCLRAPIVCIHLEGENVCRCITGSFPKAWIIVSSIWVFLAQTFRM